MFFDEDIEFALKCSNLTTIVVNTGHRSFLDVITAVKKYTQCTPVVFDIDNKATVADLWKALHATDKETPFILRNIQRADSDKATEEQINMTGIIQSMIKREPYTPPGQKKSIDFAERWLILETKVASVEDWHPSYFSSRGNVFLLEFNMLPADYKVTQAEVERTLKLWDTLPKYAEHSKALYKLFKEMCPENREMPDILLKVATLNDFYSTYIFDTYSVGEYYHRKGANGEIDRRLNAEDTDCQLVNELANVESGEEEKPRHFYSFATKYCSHHQPEKYPIYDRYVSDILVFFRDQSARQNGKPFHKFREKDLFNDYEKFVKTIDAFRTHYHLEQYTYKQIDQYLWLLGKFPEKVN